MATRWTGCCRRGGPAGLPRRARPAVGSERHRAPKERQRANRAPTLAPAESRLPSPSLPKESGVEAANEYLSSALAHTAYFDNPDVSAFLLRHVIGEGHAPPRALARRHDSM